MDDVKRKKKYKKNKGKLTKAADSAVAGSVESPQTEQAVNHESAPGQNKQETDVGTVHVGNEGKTVDDMILVTEEPTRNGPYGSDVNSEADIEQNHQDPDTGITSAQSVLDADSSELERHTIKESDFMELREMLKGLQNNMVSCIEKEFILGKKIELLQNENESFIKKQNIWNLKLEQLHSEMRCCSIKEADLENRLNCLEKGNESRISEESLIGQIVIKLEEANTGLHKQQTFCGSLFSGVGTCNGLLMMMFVLYYYNGGNYYLGWMLLGRLLLPVMFWAIWNAWNKKIFE